MFKANWILKTALAVVALFMALGALAPYVKSQVSADSGRFDYVYVVSPVYLYQGNQGVLLLDKRNGNVWFIGKGNEMNITFKDPVFVARLPLEKLDQAPR